MRAMVSMIYKHCISRCQDLNLSIAKPTHTDFPSASRLSLGYHCLFVHQKERNSNGRGRDYEHRHIRGNEKRARQLLRLYTLLSSQSCCVCRRLCFIVRCREVRDSAGTSGCGSAGCITAQRNMLFLFQVRVHKVVEPDVLGHLDRGNLVKLSVLGNVAVVHVQDLALRILGRGRRVAVFLARILPCAADTHQQELDEARASVDAAQQSLKSIKEKMAAAQSRSSARIWKSTVAFKKRENELWMWHVCGLTHLT